jgi:GNAT superfamily N-acetyltransferase
MAVTLRTYRDIADRRVLQELASRLWPLGHHPGGLGWADAIGQLADPIVIAEVAGGPVGWAGIDSRELLVLADPEVPEAAPELLEWSLAAGAGRNLTIGVAHADPALGEAVRAAGFEPGGSDHLVGPVLGMFLAVPAPTPVLPRGYRVRSVRPDELEARVQVHRAAWRPAALPHPPGRPAPDPQATSRFTAPLYERVRDTWLYDEMLDLVVEAPDRSLAACCILWWDPATGTGEIEPLGVAPEHRRLGLAAAMCHQAAALVEARGGGQVYVNVEPDESYPAPGPTYLSAGFEVVRRGTAYQRAC